MTLTPRTARSLIFAAFAVLFSAFASTTPAAAVQVKNPFTIDDYFKAVSLRVEDWTRDGRWLACTMSRASDRLPQDYKRYGDPTYVSMSPSDLVVLDTETGEQVRVFHRPEAYRSPTWSPDGRRLALFQFKDQAFWIVVWNRDTRKLEKWSLPSAKSIAPNSPLAWTADGHKLFFHVRALDWAAKASEMFRSLTSAPIRVFDSEKPFLPWDELSRRSRLVIPVLWEPEAGKAVELLPETALVSSRLSEDGRFLLYERDVSEKTNYDVIGGTRNQLEVQPLGGVVARVLLKPYDQRPLVWDKNGRMFAYADKGDVFIMDVDDKEPRRLTGEAEAAPATSPAPAKPEAKAGALKKPAFSVVRFSPDGAALLCTSARPQAEDEKAMAAKPANPPRQYWLVDIKTAGREMIYELPEKEEERPTLQPVDWSPDGRFLYFGTSATDRYDRGLVRLDVRAKTRSDLLRTSRLPSRWRMAEDGSRFVYMESDGDRPDELFVADAELRKPRRLTDLNPELADRAFSRTELIAYRDADGKTLYGVLYYPAGYEKGKKYPLITEVYETYFENGFSPALNIFTSAGYAVLHPSVQFATGYPGEAWAKGALAAVNRVIDMGVADPDRLGIQGTSYGGYATVLLLTQTDRFKAAINNSGKVNLLSFYTQSPRLGVRNTHAPEKSQDRIGGTLWDYPERYLAQSAILRADRITTPLLCITGDLDPNVEAVQSQEIFIALRRLGKKCVWLSYGEGAHGGPNSNEERRDMYRRMLEWYDTYLKKAAS
jgi:dipeptidyl aminopeptidase/acylaminoacyl peptidase